MRLDPSFVVNHTSHRVASFLAGLALAMTMIRFGTARERLDHQSGE